LNFTHLICIIGCEEAFKAVSAAYKCLSNEDSKKMYDMTGSDNGDAYTGNASQFNGVNPNELFAQMFAQQFGSGMRGGAGGPTPFVFHFGAGQPGFASFRQNSAPPSPTFEVPQPIKKLLSIIPWQVVVCILLYLGVRFAIFIFHILSRIGHIVFAVLYLAPKNYRWGIVLLVITLAMLDFL
jgi:hypothetical protein